LKSVIDFLLIVLPIKYCNIIIQKDYLQETCEVVRIYMRYHVYSLMLNRYDVKRIIAR